MAALIIGTLVFFLQSKKLDSQFDTTAFDLTIFDGKEPYLTYQGNAHVTTHSVVGGPINQPFIRLTSANLSATNRPIPLPNSVGRVLYSPPIRLWDQAARRQANFQTVIRGYIGNPWTNSLSDGLAFFVVPAVNRSIPWPPGAHMGLYDSSGGSPVPLLAAEIDVFVNSWDPNFRHVGININSRISETVERWDANGFGREVEARVTYDARARLISVVANDTYKLGPPMVATVEHVLDLKTLLPEWVHIGISASTETTSAGLHDIYRWSFTSFMVSDDEDTYIPQYV